MKFLDYIQLANQKQPNAAQSEPFSIALISNFTDDTLAKVIEGVCLKNQVAADIYKAPYKQYAFLLKNQNSELWQRPRRLTFFFFDLNFYSHSEFSDGAGYGEGLIDDLEKYAAAIPGTIVINTFLLPYHGPRGNQVTGQKLFLTALRLNEKLYRLAKTHNNVHIFDINRLAHARGEQAMRDLRGLHAFDIPFTNDFLTALAEEWSAYIMALCGKSKKIIVVDLDNTLWGGIVGELGSLGIALGPNYPGIAFQNFQRALLHYYNSGILLAINSKNNEADVLEVFEKNPHMVLRKEHFAAIVANWQDKSDNLMAIASKLNLGLESFVFFDDDPIQREMVKKRLPEVMVPEFSVPPEEYAKILFGLPVFSPFPGTREDADKNRQYSEEQKRQELKAENMNLPNFIANLGIKMDVSLNQKEHVPRISQLSLKTNQCNATTRRYAEKDIFLFMEKSWVFDADIKDKFGNYGLTAVAIAVPKNAGSREARIDTFLMSCRILGRGIEFSFLDYVVRELARLWQTKILTAEFIPTAKNEPAKHFFKTFGFKELATDGQGHAEYRLDCEAYCKTKNPNVYESVTINQK